MESTTNRYQKLGPLTVSQRISIALAALRFFSPVSYRENCEKLGLKADPKTIRPFSGMDFINFLDKPGVLPEPLLSESLKYMQRINELLRHLARAGLLTEQGLGQSPIMGNYYYSLYEATAIEKTGVLILARALGPSFLHWAYQAGTYQITGTVKNGDQHAGTGIAIAPRWLMTCAHVVQDMKIDNHQSHLGLEFNIIREVAHERVDVALIEVDRDLHVVKGLNFRDPHIAERVFTFGYPRVPLSIDAALVMQGGEVSVEKITSFSKENLFLFSAIARPGNSGGPILSEDGHVVGIVTKELSENDPFKQPFHAGIAASTLNSALQELDCSVSLPVETWQ